MMARNVRRETVCMADRRVGPAPIALVLGAMLVLGASPASAQTAVCSNTPVTGGQIECKKDANSIDDINIDFQSGVNIETSAAGAAGILGDHRGTGDITIKVKGVSGADTTTTITTSGESADGIFGSSTGKGSVDITVSDVVITTMATDSLNPGARGVAGEQIFLSSNLVPDVGVFYNVNINVSGSRISTMGSYGYGIYGLLGGRTDDISMGDLEITATNTHITTAGSEAAGLYAQSIDSSGDVIVNMTGGSITTRGENAKGIQVLYQSQTSTLESSGDVRVTVTDNAEIRTEYAGTGSSKSEGIGVQSSVLGDSDVFIMLDDAIISTQYHGVSASRNRGPGAIDIDVRGGSITTKRILAYGIYAYHRSEGDITIDVQDATIATESKEIFSNIGALAFGIYGQHEGDGDINIDVRGDSSITTLGNYSYGIQGRHANNGHVAIKTHDGHTITTTGENAHGIVAYHLGTMDTRSMAITVGGDVDASGAGAHGVRVGTTNNGAPERVAALDVVNGYRKQTVTVNGSVMGEAAGVWLAGGGRVVIGPKGTIDAQSGIAILATGTVPEVPAPDPNNVAAIPAILPKLWVDMNLGGRRVAQAIGDNWIVNDGGETTILVNNVKLHDGERGVTGRTAANGAWNVRMREEGVNVDYITDPNPANWEMIKPTAGVVADRDFSAQDFNEARRPSPPPPPPPMPMPQTVMVDEPVFGDADDVAGVHLPAGGRVRIGPRGTVGAESGIAILAEGDAPMLHVDMNLDGRRVRDVIGDDWIINDGGETTIVVNGVTLHDGATGVVEDAVAPNGGNVRVTQRSRRATGVVRDAMAANGAFNVTMRPEGVTVLDRSDPDPANWVITEPVGGVVADRDFSAEDFIETSTQPMFMEEYAPRAALYEILPDFLLRLTGPGPSRRCGSTPDSSVWTRVAGGQGVYESDRSTTGATYDLERFEAEGGLSASLGARAKGWVSVRHVQGTAGVASPTGGGEIDVRGLGSSVGGSWQGANDVYAVGCFSYLAYDVDFASTRQGVLKAGVDGQAYTLDLEVGRRYAVGEQAQLTPRVWVMGSRVSVDDFTDAVDARVSLANAARVLVGLGVQADTTRPWAGGAFLLRGSVDIEQMVSGATTTTQVSGERLSADATDTSLLFGLRGIYRHDRVTVGAEIAARQELGSTDSEYTSFLNLGLSF